jgi:hypothetical protein
MMGWHGLDSSGSVKCWEFFDYLRYLQLLKKDCCMAVAVAGAAL